MKKTIFYTMLVLVALLATPSAYAATMTYNFNPQTIITSDMGEEIINGHQANLTITVLTNSSKPFNLTNLPGADDINVTVQFLDALGTAVDVTGDGVVDTFTATENASSPGVYDAYINTSARPGEYTMRIHAVAYNSTTGSIVDEGRLDVQEYIADEYWDTAWINDGEKMTLGTKNFNYNFQLDTINDRGAIMTLGNSLVTLSPDTTTGEIFHQVNLTPTTTAWMFVKKTPESGLNEVKFYSRNDILPKIDEKISVSGNTVTRETWLKDGSNYRQIVLWDQSPTAFIKAIDYYIIPAKGEAYWKEGWGGGYSGKSAIIKRTTWFNLISSEKKVFDGNIFGRTVGDDILKLSGRWAGNRAYFGAGGWVGWEVMEAIARLVYPTNYDLKYRQAAIPAELGLRGKVTMPSIFGQGVNWNALVAGNSTLS